MATEKRARGIEARSQPGITKGLPGGAKGTAKVDRELTAIDREVVEALTDLRDTLRDRVPLEKKYTVRHVVVATPPPPMGADDVRRAREALGVSQPVFAGLLGTSPSTVRSWEQGQKAPSAMARRLLGLIESDPAYWRSRFF
jgi:putative transcriptional regulator